MLVRIELLGGRFFVSLTFSILLKAQRCLFYIKRSIERCRYSLLGIVSTNTQSGC